MTGPLLAAADLEVRRQRAEVLILDATVHLASAAHDGDHRSESGLPGWREAHIPGSRHADLLHALSDAAAPYHFAVPTPDALAEALADLGVRDGVPVVTYDRAGGLWSARLWYLLDWLGIEAYVLDGGFAAWQSANLPIATVSAGAVGRFGSPDPAANAIQAVLAGAEGGVGSPAPAVGASRDGSAGAEGRLGSGVAGGGAGSAGAEGSIGGSDAPLDTSRAESAGLPGPVGRADAPLGASRGLTVAPQPGRWVGKADLAAWVAGDVDAIVLCALNPEAYAGEVPTRYTRRGHIPGSGNLPARTLTGKDGRFLPRPELRAALGDLIEDPAPVWLYCGGGISATVVALALAAAGRPDVALYDGSLEEWSVDPDLPLDLGRA